jgi:alanine racemase
VPPAFSRPNWAAIDRAALRHNARALAHHAAPARLIAVVKAGAYGHGALEVARALESVESVTMLGVASVDEAQILRAGGIQTEILLLSALLPAEASAAVELDVAVTVGDVELARALNQAASRRRKRAKTHFKVDTGMSRLGANWCEAARVFREVQALESLEIAGIYTHFASADEDDDFTATQLRRFHEFCAEIGPGNRVLKHAANSAGALRFPAAHFDLVRPGIALYGAHPCPKLGPNLDLQPVMTWRARISALKSIAQGQSVSYGATWTAPRASRIAVVPAGYADGYSRALSNRGEVLIHGEKCSVVGRVTMDQILVDVTAINAQIGDEVTLWGQGLPVEEVAERAGTISYELLCGVSARVPRVYLNP